MSANLLFGLAFATAAPFWALMILLPKWRGTKLVAGSPWIVAPVLVVWLIASAPVWGELLVVVSGPTLAGFTQLLGSPTAVAAIWAQVIAWDLFIGRWVYLDSRERRLRSLPMAPILVVMVLLSPVGLPVYLGLRTLSPLRPTASSALRPACLTGGFRAGGVGVEANPGRVGEASAWPVPQ